GAVGDCRDTPGGNQRADPRNRAHQSDHETDLAPHQPGDLRGQIKHNPVDTGLNQQVDRAQVQHSRLAHGLEHTAVALFLTVFSVEHGLQLLAFFSAQPLGVCGAVVQIEIGPDAHGRRHQAFDREQPLPAMAAEHAVQFQQQTRERAAEDERQRCTKVKEAHGPSACCLREPV
nr:hypothetical protein [Tanacetum cinerariifolium]